MEVGRNTDAASAPLKVSGIAVRTCASGKARENSLHHRYGRGRFVGIAGASQRDQYHDERQADHDGDADCVERMRRHDKRILPGGLELQSGPSQAEQRFTGDQARCGQYARVFDSRLLCFVQTMPQTASPIR